MQQVVNAIIPSEYNLLLLHCVILSGGEVFFFQERKGENIILSDNKALYK